jgi:hypothetical protein
MQYQDIREEKRPAKYKSAFSFAMGSAWYFAAPFSLRAATNRHVGIVDHFMRIALMLVFRMSEINAHGSHPS